MPDKSKCLKRSLTQFVRTLVHMDSGFNGIQIKDDPELLQEIEISVQFPYLTQCSRTDLSKRFLPKPMTTQGERGPSKESKSR